jgi:tRNA (adenine57-N1/adenine58-N1)-methyltransferase
VRTRPAPCDDNMAFRENELVYAEDSSGKRHWFRMSGGMIKIPSLGTLDGGRLMDSEDGSAFSLAGEEFFLFRPGVTELMDSLDRGAQIITPKDAASILLNCDVKCGDTVLEVGAGSGGLTTALLHATACSGKVVTVELKEENAKITRRNVSRSGSKERWECVMGDAKSVSLDLTADVLTMDMPDPWLALDNLLPHLRSGGRICIYVPNMNQMESSVLALRERGFAGVRAVENIQRGMDVHPGGVRPAYEMLSHTGYLIFGRKRTF